MAGPSLDLIDSGADVRMAIGGSDIDVTDPVIESLMIGYLAEVKVKARVPYWASIIDGTRYAGSADPTKADTQRIRLKAAATYYAAGLLARRLESGAIPLVAGGAGTQIPRDWKVTANEMFAHYGSLLSEITTADPEGGAATIPLPVASFGMFRDSRSSHANDWMTDPPIAHIMRPLDAEDWDED